MTGLPPEIWSIIFAHLGKRYIMDALLVCKYWNQLLNSIYRQYFTTRLHRSRFEPFLNDIAMNPILASRIKGIKVCHSHSIGLPELLLETINHCPNLLTLIFMHGNISGYTKMLDCSQVHLTNINEIRIKTFPRCSDEVKDLIIGVNNRFRETINMLQLSSIITNSALEVHGGLTKYTRCFSNLESLSICGDFVDRKLFRIDLNSILMVNTNLRHLKIQNVRHITGDASKIPSCVDIAYTPLEELSLARFKTDISIIRHISSRFTRLKKLIFCSARIALLEDGQDEDQIFQESHNLPAKKTHIQYYLKTRRQKSSISIILNKPSIFLIHLLCVYF